MSSVATAGVALQPVLADADAVVAADDAVQRDGERREADKPRDGERRDADRREEARPSRLAGAVVKLDNSKTPHTLTIRVADGVLLSFDLAKDVTYTMAGRAADLTKLKEGSRVAVQLAADNRTVAAITAEARMAYGAVSAVDTSKKTVTVTRLLDGGGVGPASTYDLANEVQVIIDRAPASVAELAGCRVARLELDGDDKVFRATAEWAGREDPRGRIKAVDPANNQLTLSVVADGERVPS